jgi:hypothetical protein
VKKEEIFVFCVRGNKNRKLSKNATHGGKFFWQVKFTKENLQKNKINSKKF